MNNGIVISFSIFKNNLPTFRKCNHISLKTISLSLFFCWKKKPMCTTTLKQDDKILNDIVTIDETDYSENRYRFNVPNVQKQNLSLIRRVGRIHETPWWKSKVPWSIARRSDRGNKISPAKASESEKERKKKREKKKGGKNGRAT